MPTATAASELYLGHFETLAGQSAPEPEWLRELRFEALTRFLVLGPPSTSDEEYKYTDLSKLADERMPTGDPPDQCPAPIPAYARMGSHRLVLGAPGSDLGNLPPGLRVLPLTEALRFDDGLLRSRLANIAPWSNHALTALNTSYFDEGVLVQADPGIVVDEPIHLVFGSTVRQPRVLITAGRSASVRVVETYVGTGRYWRNAVTEVDIGENARVEHCRAEAEPEGCFHTSVLQAVQERDSHFSTFSLSFGAKFVRNDVQTRLNGQGCECHLDGLYTVQDGQHVDHHTTIDHAQPHCHSNQLYKGVLEGRAKGVFNGKIIVRQDAQKTDAIQSNKNLLLSKEAEVNTKPQLEIDANDVRCTHGATVGQLDAGAAFYLRSRGIGEAEARNMLTYAFAADALNKIRFDQVRRHFESQLLTRFAPGRL